MPRLAPAALAAILSQGMPLPAAAAPLDVQFEPPDVQLQPLCDPRPPDDEIVAAWSGWDGEGFGDRSTSLVRRDLRRLAALDPERWDTVILGAMERLREADPDYDALDHLADRIDFLVTTERFATLEAEGLVERFLEMEIQSSPRALHMAGELLLNGYGIGADVQRAQAFMVQSAYAGNPEALLDLAQMTSDGSTVPGWDVAPELAVTLAFGALVGDLDARLCDRINRIGSAFRVGEIVAQDLALAERWYRLSADLGDHNAAWQVARLHMEAIGLERDNTAALTYLEQAAEAGLGFAQAELGQVYEVGALAPQDIDAARRLYEAAAERGERDGLVRLVGLADSIEEPGPEDRARQEDALRRLAEMPDAPAWVLAQMGDMILENQGRWAGEAEAAAFFRRALEAEPGHPTAVTRLARIGFRHARTLQEFLVLTSDLQEVVVSVGTAAGMEQLRDAFHCRSPEAPHADHARYWDRMYGVSGYDRIELTPPEIAAQAADPDPVLLAKVQTQALTGRSPSYALLRDLPLEADSDVMRRLSRDAASGPLTERAKALLRRADPDAAPPGRALELLRQAVAEGENGAQAVLLEALTSAGAMSDEAELRRLAEALAARGEGLGLRTLAGLAEEPRDVFDSYAEVIEARGDFEALIFALGFLEEEARVSDYLGRARAAMNCNLPHALEMVAAADRHGRAEAVERWLDVSAAVAENEGWQMVSLADAMLARGTTDGSRDRALALLRQARQDGHRLAMLRLLSLADAEDSGLEMEPEEVADLFVDLVAASELEDVPGLLDRVGFAAPDVRASVRERIDPVALYEEAAAAGVPEAQLELARIVRADAAGPEALTEYVRLLTGAAEGGEPEAMFLLSNAYSLGLGVAPSLEESRRWLTAAAEAGHPEAAATVRLLQTQETQQ
ncbi:tetratricopeptide repeat protein [Histidinibacterium lentulum]|nr:SEL1-like repeat protein [Histidinibacterium lentulum]